MAAKPLVNFQNSEKLDSDNFCQFYCFSWRRDFSEISAVFADVLPYSLKAFVPGSQSLSSTTPGLILGKFNVCINDLPTPLLLSPLTTFLLADFLFQSCLSYYSDSHILNQCPQAKLSTFVSKVYLNTALLLSLIIVYSFFHTT